MEKEATRENLELLARIFINQKEAVISWFRPIFQGKTIDPLMQTPPNTHEWESRLVGPVNQTASLFGVQRILTYAKTGSLLSDYSVSGSRKFSHPTTMLVDDIASVVKEDSILHSFKSSDDGAPHLVVLMPLSHDDETVAVMAIVMDLSSIVTEFAHASGYQSTLVFQKEKIPSATKVDENGKSSDRLYKLRKVQLPAQLFSESAILEVSVDDTELQGHLQNIRRNILIYFGSFIILSVPFLTWVLARLIAPLHQLVDVVAHISQGKYHMRVAERGSTEILNLSSGFNSMINNIESANRVILQKSAQLELVVGTIRSIFHGVEQGILVIDGDMSVSGEYSKYFEAIVGHSNIQGKNLDALIFERSSLTKEDVAKIRASISSMVGDPLFAFQLNAHLLPREIQFFAAKNSCPAQFLEFEWMPLIDNEENVSGIIVTVRDITQIKQLKEDAKQDRREIEMIAQVVAVPSHRFETFMQSCRQALGGIHDSTLVGFSQSTLFQMKRDLHTMKGNCRVLGLSYLAECVHEAEDQVGLVVKLNHENTEESVKVRDAFIGHIRATHEILTEYFSIHSEKLQRTSNTQKAEKAERIHNIVQKSMRFLSSSEGLKGEDSRTLLCEIVSLDGFNLESLSYEFRDSVEQMAQCNLKPIPELRVEDRFGWVFDSSLMEALRNCFVHLLSNSVIHGLDAKKTERPTLNFRTHYSLLPAITYWDSGEGVNLSKIKSRAESLNVATENLTVVEILELLFLPGFSTADRVTQFAGRGVGLDAARSTIRAIGGELRLIPQGDVLRNGHVRVEFEIVLPMRHIFNHSLSEAS
ncbi:MAG TPA: HAMP domain-containing protein [Oligoflexus sp.]|uniref:HAMP domain-containing protein n=1 Tax=Oligoflexus sp. TaxID=1971216 RepID=UPI002D345A27|nr:HAMP domain-containing protein [Oligoflexus sp.]HYX34374.1 HAMP domain-containing protein [Oligoflexus sp.]